MSYVLKIFHYICRMKELLRLCHTLLLFILATMFASCYTGTESTPRIKVDKEVLYQPTIEELVIDNNFSDKGCHTWSEGKAFTSIEEALSPMLRPEDDATLIDDGLKGEIFTYKGYREENIFGDKAVVYLLFECNGHTYSYYTGKSIEEIKESNYLPLIPSLIDMDAVAMARSLFVGKQLYILTNHWYNLQGNVIEGNHLVAVNVTAVEPGNNVLPLAIHFTDQRGVEAQVYITTKSSAHTQMLSFDRLFSYKNPREEHEEISDEVWQAITESRLLKGMTKNECRLSIGLPSEVNKIPTYNGLKEQWLYNSGAYLFFSDGILEEFRQ